MTASTETELADSGLPMNISIQVDGVKPASRSTTASPVSKSAHPVDKGWSWVIVLGTFGVHFFCFGYIRSFGILFLEFQEKFDASSGMTSVVSGVQFCSYSLSTLLVVNVVLKRFSIRQSCMVGCFVQCLGIALNGMVPGINYLILTQGILFGTGLALLYCPALLILSQYFNEKRAIATAIATCGVSAGGVSLPFLIRHLVDNYGLRGGLLLLSAIMFHQAVFASLFTPTSKYTVLSVDQIISPNDVQDNQNIRTKLDVNDSHPQCQESDIRAENKIPDHVNISHAIEELPYQYAITSKQDEDSSHLLGQSSNHTQVSCQSDAALSKQADFPLGSEENKADIEDTKDTDHERDRVVSPPGLTQYVGANDCPSGERDLLLSNSHIQIRLRSNSEQESELENAHDSDLYLQRERSPTEDGLLFPHDPSNKPSLKSAMINALSASAMDVHGSLHSLTHKGMCVQDQGDPNQRYERKDKTRWWRGILIVIKDVNFWILLVFFAAGGTASSLPTIFLPPLAKEKNMEEHAPLLLILSALTELFGRLMPGVILHFGFLRPSSVVILPMAACGTVYQFTWLYNDYGDLVTMAILIGALSGAYWAMQSLIVIEVFGLPRLGTMLGFYLIVLGLSVGASNPISGLLKDMSGTYASTFHYFGAMYYLAALMMVLIQFIKRVHSKGPA